MVIIENHFNNNTTIILNEFIINGCTVSKIDRFLAVCRLHKVSTEIRNDIERLYNENLNTEDNVLEFYLKYKNKLPEHSRSEKEDYLAEQLLKTNDIEFTNYINKIKNEEFA